VTMITTKKIPLPRTPTMASLSSLTHSVSAHTCVHARALFVLSAEF